MMRLMIWCDFRLSGRLGLSVIRVRFGVSGAFLTLYPGYAKVVMATFLSYPLTFLSEETRLVPMV
jgi:hypothetical protein